MDRLKLTAERGPAAAARLLVAPIDTHGALALPADVPQPGAARSRTRRSPTTASATSCRTTTQKLLDHAETLRAAFSLTGDEFALIVAALGFDANTPLTLDNISAVFRRGWLARKLSLSVREFLLLDPLHAASTRSPRPTRRTRRCCASSTWCRRCAPPR